MLENIFEIILKMSFNASVVALAVVIARFALKRAPKKWSYLLWGTVGFRLIFPFSLKSFFSIFSLIKFKQSESVIISETVEMPVIYSSSNAFVDLPTIENVQTAVTQPIEQGASLADPAVNADFNFMKVLAIVWLVGFAAMLIYGLVASVRLNVVLSNSVKHEDNIFLSEKISSPFVFGIFEPKIYIPFGITDNKLEIVIAHELCHISRLDHVIKLLAFLLLCVHWFNPFVWLSFVLMGKDMELSCDEKVLSNGEYDGVEYSRTLLSLATQKRFPSPCPIAFGESGIKTRIKNALKWKRPGKIIAFVAPLVAIIVLAACSLDPAEGKNADITGEYDLWSVEYSSPGIWVDYTDAEYPSFRVNDNMNLQVKNDVNFPSEDWITIVHLEEKKLKKSEFSGIAADEFDTEVLVEENANAYYGEWEFSEENTACIWFLEQTDGNTYLVMGYTSEENGKLNVSYIFSLAPQSAERWEFKPMLSFTGWSQITFIADTEREYSEIEIESTGGELSHGYFANTFDSNIVTPQIGNKINIGKGNGFIWSPYVTGKEDHDKNAVISFTVKNGTETVYEGRIKIFELPDKDELIDGTYCVMLDAEGLSLKSNDQGSFVLTDKTETVLESTQISSTTLSTTEPPEMTEPPIETTTQITTSASHETTTFITEPPVTQETTIEPYNPFDYKEPFSEENIKNRIYSLFCDSEYISTVYNSDMGLYSAMSRHPVYRSLANGLLNKKITLNEISGEAFIPSLDYVTFSFDERTNTTICFYSSNGGVMEVTDDNGNKTFYTAEVISDEGYQLWDIAKFDFLHVEMSKEIDVVYYGKTAEEAMFDYGTLKTFEHMMNLSPNNSQRITDFAIYGYEVREISEEGNTIIFNIIYFLKPEKINEFMYGGAATKYGDGWGEWSNQIKFYTDIAMRRIEGTDNWKVIEKGQDLTLNNLE